MEGEVEISWVGERRTMRAADYLYLDAGVPHELIAIKNTSILVTVVLRR